MVSYVERGLRGPTLDTVLRLGHALNVNPTDLINRAIKETQTITLRGAKRRESGR